MCSEKQIWPAVHVLDTESCSQSFWDAFDFKFLILSTNSLMVKTIQETRLREALC